MIIKIRKFNGESTFDEIIWVDFNEVIAISDCGTQSEYFRIYFKNGNFWVIRPCKDNTFAEILTKWEQNNDRRRKS